MACEGAVGGPSVFVTVGTTSFPALVAAVTSPAALEQLYERGIRCLVVQYGREKWPTDAPPLDSVVKGVHITGYSVKPSTSEDIAAAEFVICHGGAGSIFDVVRANTPLIVVPNTSLMGNHQMELVKAMKEASHIAATTPEGLPSLLKSVDFTALVPVPPPNGDLFRKRVDVAMGLA